jgi:hypothetical protein
VEAEKREVETRIAELLAAIDAEPVHHLNIVFACDKLVEATRAFGVAAYKASLAKQPH